MIVGFRRQNYRDISAQLLVGLVPLSSTAWFGRGEQPGSWSRHAGTQEGLGGLCLHWQGCLSTSELHLLLHGLLG